MFCNLFCHHIQTVFPTDCEDNRQVVNYDSVTTTGGITVTGGENMDDPIEDVFAGSDETNPIGPTNPDEPITFTIDLGAPGTSQLMGLRFTGENVNSVEITAVADTPTPQQETEVRSKPVALKGIVLIKIYL